MTSTAPEKARRDLAARADADAALDVEQRSTATTLVIIVLALLFWATAEYAALATPSFVLCFAVVTPLAFLRLALAAYARRFPPGSAARLRLVFGPLLALVATWSAFATWGAVDARGTPLCTVIVATQCLCCAAVVLSYAGTPRVAIAIIATMIAPISFALLAYGGADRMLGPGALLFGVMLVTYLPRVARERRAGVVSMLLLAERARSLEEARDAAVAAAAAKETFFVNLSHEIRTPLHGLLGTAERLRGMGLGEQQHLAVEQLYRCGQTLMCTLNDALDSIRLESGKLQLHPARLALPELLREVIETFADEAKRKNLTLKLDADVVGCVVGDAQRLRQVLQNLVGNAVKFTERGSVTVIARTPPIEGTRVTLSIDVVDTGVGFAEVDRARLFQRFSQLSARSDGSGLGLAISAELVRLMDGTIDATSEGAEQGSCFRIRIPLPAPPDGPIEVAGRRVLVVDDNPVNLAVASAYLEGLGIGVDAVGDGDAALTRAAATRYDAILMDCNMPDKDGFATTRELRARGDTTPVLAITATTDGSTAQRCKDAGMEALVEKPISSGTLREALARVMTSRES